MGVSWNDDDTSDEEEGFDDSFKDDEFASLSPEDVSSPTKGSKLAKKKFTAKRKYGERCIPDPSINRDCAVVGPPDLSKLSVTFQTERPEPNNPDWNDKKSVDKLNSWRYQLFKRTIGQKRESRPPWTISEQNKVIELVHAHLNASSTGGRYSKVKWNEIERNFNQYFQNQFHRKGEMTAETAYNTRGEDRVAKSRKLMADRLHVSRSAGAIENQFNHFTHPTARQLIADARKADQDYDETRGSFDDDIIKSERE
ncbi:hypothetical protein NA56DRAFT_308287 [Hyaloscypha hepaticicola]|uniref:Uncharacterized protein n=1 Tax=Hyaloscypha hepaticicola TaxID=2082293 RepID=A0A2J6PRM8_9HELO|nr:hypothetical protein NA56DRAFT_308287 [Hyaloscypha hepaticicola]